MKPFGTVRWFGPSWGAPVNDPANEIEVPVGEECVVCHRPIAVGEPGIRLPYMDGVGGTGYAFYHRDHFLELTGIITNWRDKIQTRGEDIDILTGKRFDDE